MESLSKLAALCSEITVILAALAMLIKPIRNKLLGLDKLTDALKCQLRHDMLRAYYKHRESAGGQLLYHRTAKHPTGK